MVEDSALPIAWSVERAKISACNSGVNISYHFTNVVQMAQIGDSQAFRETLKDYKLSRYACYITAMNGDPRKPEIAAAQSYFAFLTRKAELGLQHQQLIGSVLEKLDRHNHVMSRGKPSCYWFFSLVVWQVNFAPVYQKA